MISLLVLAIGGVALGVMLACLGHLVYTDLKRRIIPRRDCYAIALSGTILQLLFGGLQAWFVGFGFGVAALVLCLSIDKLASRRCSKSIMLGGGDVRLIVALSLATGPWAVWGAFGAAIAALLWAITGLITSRLSLGDTFAMAPCLAWWPIASFVASLL